MAYVKALYWVACFSLIALGGCGANSGSTDSVDPNTTPPAANDTRFTLNNDGSLRLRHITDDGIRHDVALSLTGSIDNVSRYDDFEESDYHYSAVFIRGDAVDLGVFNFYHDDGNGLYDAGYVLDGTTATPPLTAIYSYRGFYIASFGRDRSDYSTQSTPIVIEANFDAATIRGWDVPNQSIIRIEGTINGTTHSGEIFSPQGYAEYDGAFFGTDAHEIGGGFVNGGVSGGFYGLYDAARTDAIN